MATDEVRIGIDLCRFYDRLTLIQILPFENLVIMGVIQVSFWRMLLKALQRFKPLIYDLNVNLVRRKICETFSQLDEQEPLDRVVNRLIQSGKDQFFAAAMRTEFLHMFSLLAVTHGPFVPSKLVDEFWHTFLLFTEDYRRFCQQRFGRMVEHRPHQIGQPLSFKDEDAAIKTLEFISACFPDYNRAVWESLTVRVEVIRRNRIVQETERRQWEKQEQERREEHERHRSDDPCSGCCSPDD